MRSLGSFFSSLSSAQWGSKGLHLCHTVLAMTSGGLSATRQTHREEQAKRHLHRSY